MLKAKKRERSLPRSQSYKSRQISNRCFSQSVSGLRTNHVTVLEHIRALKKWTYSFDFVPEEVQGE